MDNRKQAGFTPPGADFPPYVNIREVDDGLIEVTVRGAKVADQIGPGPIAAIQMSADEFKALIGDAFARIFGP